MFSSSPSKPAEASRKKRGSKRNAKRTAVVGGHVHPGVGREINLVQRKSCFEYDGVGEREARDLIANQFTIAEVLKVDADGTGKKKGSASNRTAMNSFRNRMTVSALGR